MRPLVVGGPWCLFDRVMTQLAYCPGPPLADFIEVLWYYRGGDSPHARERLMPDGTMSIIINLREDSLPVYDGRDPAKFDLRRGTLWVGTQSGFSIIDTACQAELMGVQFRPGGAAAFMDGPAGELHGLKVNLESIWSEDAAELRSALKDAPTVSGKFRVLAGRLRARLRPAARPHPVVAFALHQFHTEPECRLDELVGRTGYSARRFIELFSAGVGLTPKLYQRVWRFQSVLRRLYAGPSDDFAGLAHAAGYYDQAHFNHEFRAFSGLTPGAYLAQRGPHANHVPLADQVK